MALSKRLRVSAYLVKDGGMCDSSRILLASVFRAELNPSSGCSSEEALNDSEDRGGSFFFIRLELEGVQL